MKILQIIVGFIFLAVLPAFGDNVKAPHNVKPKNGLVPNKETAIQIAVAVWTPIYGKKNIERQKPYKAWLKDGVWFVSGSLPKQTLGGVAIAEIQKSDAKILRISHGM